jgi:oligopeptide transport system substrate-binding protein
MRNNFVKVFLPVILTSIFFSSCFKKNDESLTAKKSMRLRWARQADPSTLDSSKCFLVDCRQILSLWLEGLTELKNDNQQLTVIPRLAESWTLSKSNVYRFQIKKNVVWSDGVPFTASDLIFSWRNGLTEKNPVLRQLFHDVVNADLFANRLVEWAEVGIKQRGLHTIEITLTSVNPRFPIVFSHPVTWPSRAKQNRKSIPSLGPFVLDQWVAGSHMVLNKNRKYHGRAPHLDGIDITIVPHAGTRIQLFLEHETDLVDAVPNEFTPQLWGTIGFEAIPTNTWMGVIFNTGKRPFNQSKVRQAFQQSINRSEFQDLLKWQDVGIPSLLMYSTTEGKHEPGIGPAFSASAAQGILADLKPDSPNLLLVFPPNDNGREIAQNLQAQWLKNINFKIDISSAPNAAAA